VQAFSIDDSATTEIDDALSVQGLGSGTVVFGIHIAAPGLAITPDSPLDKVARERLSTVYMPGWKITMLPDEVVQAYTLTEGRDCPAVSLYVTLRRGHAGVKGSETKLERVPIVSQPAPRPARRRGHRGLAQARRPGRLRRCRRAGLRLPPGAAPEGAARGRARQARELQPARLQLQARRRGAEPDGGDEVVLISTRQRGAPLDLIVAEAMILANSTWGGWLAECGVPGIYRSQASLLPGIKVRMGTKPAPHAGMGVAQYTWATSPLRRYVDLVNQWQIIACARHGRTAALAAPFRRADAMLFSIISGFDAAYSAYNDFQHGIERLLDACAGWSRTASPSWRPA
jgi:exoribonuclease II